MTPSNTMVVFEADRDPMWMKAGSRVSIRNTGAPGRFAWMPLAITRAAMRSASAKDRARPERVVITDTAG